MNADQVVARLAEVIRRTPPGFPLCVLCVLCGFSFRGNYCNSCLSARLQKQQAAATPLRNEKLSIGVNFIHFSNRILPSAPPPHCRAQSNDTKVPDDPLAIALP